MTISGMIMAIGMFIVFTQWQIPLQYMHMEGVLTDKSFKVRSWIGRTLSVLLYILTIVTVVSSSLFTTWTYPLTIVLGILIVIIFIYSFVTQNIANKRSGLKNERIKTLILMPFLIMAISAALAIYEYSIKGKLLSSNISLTEVINFDLTSNLAFRMLLRIFLISFAVLTFYVVLVFTAAHAKNPNNLGLIEVRYLLKKNRIYIAILIAVFLSFLHLTEVDTKNVTTVSDIYDICESDVPCEELIILEMEFDARFEKTASVYHLIASAFFIPLFFDELHSRRDEDRTDRNSRVSKLKRGMRTNKWRKK